MYLLLFAIAAATAVGAQNSYMVISPSKIRPNMIFSLSVNILKATTPVTVTATILREETIVTKANDTFRAGVPATLSLKVPAGLPSASYRLKVEGKGGLIFTNSTSLTYNSKELSLYIQSDKAIYKPGDTINFRIFGTYSDLKMYIGPVDISISDAASNKIKQWTQEQSADGVISKQLVLSSRPVLGDWSFSVQAATATAGKTFTVAEYVLPLFEVNVIMAPYIMTSDSDVTVTIKAKYTYGKPVKGTAIVGLQFLYSYYENDPSYAQAVSTVQVQIDGEAKASFPLSDLKKNISYLNGNILVVTANVTESLTGNIMSGNGTVKFYDSDVILEFPKTNPDTVKPGLLYTGYLKISQPDGRPVPASNQKVKIDSSIEIEVSFGEIIQSQTFTINLLQKQYVVPDNGLVTFTVNIPSSTKSATITAEYQGIRATLFLGKSYSPNKSYIQLFLESSSNIEAGNLIQFRVKATQQISSLVYQILSKGVIVKSGSINTMNRTEHPFSIKSDSSMAPNARIIVYYITSSGEIVADSLSFDVSGIFQNKVSISINTTDAEPGDSVKVSVSADPSSNVYVLGIDQSVLLLKTGNDVTRNDVNAELQSFDTVDQSNDCPECGWGFWWPFPISYGGSDATKVFKKSGVQVLTDTLVPEYVEPYRGRPGPFREFMPLMAFESAKSNEGGGNLMEPTRVRTQFSETWMWTQIPIGPNGTSSVVTQVHDTITSWVTSSFAANPVTGLGIAPTQARLQVFLPFFLGLNLPYSVTRGEQLALQVNVFNYMQEDMQVLVTVAKSESYSIIVCINGTEELRQEEATRTIFVKAGEAKSVFIPLVPKLLGRINLVVKAQSSKAADAVMRQLLVEPEGVPKEYNIPILIDLTEGKNSLSQTVNVSLPAKVVKDSQRVRVTAVGDLMGITINGLDSLIQQPTGCGEQTILTLAPVVYVTNYLVSVNQMSAELRSRAISYMESGYQNELNYKHDDGSFSAFGKSDKSGSVWLTGYVARAFNQARSHIFIDVNVIIKALQGIIDKQNIDGSFPEPGVVIHTTMQSNAGKGTALTVFILIALLENRDVMGSRGDQAIAKALAYVEAEVVKTEDLYILTMASYALVLANSVQTNSLLARLETKATVKDGSKYWQQEEVTTTTSSWDNPNPTKALSTEMTAYVALAYIERGEIAKAKQIIQWIIKQRNPNGGFQSTQDTVIALFAMSKFAKLIYSNNFNVNVTVTLSPTQSFNFHIDQTNALILQTQETTTVPRKFKVDAVGSGIALVEIAVFFNVEIEIDVVTYELTVKLVEENINYLVLETCTRWIGEAPSSGMVVQEIGIPSGFKPELDSITDLPILKNKDTKNKNVILYFDKIETTFVCLKIKMHRIALVAKSRPIPVRVYNYYAPEYQVTVFYESKILKTSKICEICPNCA